MTTKKEDLPRHPEHAPGQVHPHRRWSAPSYPDIHNRRKSDEWFRILVEVMAEGACITDAGGRIVYLNSRLAGILRCSEPDLVGHSPAEFIVGFEQAAQPTPNLTGKGAEGKPRQTQLIRTDGTRAVAQFSLRPFFDGDRQFRGALVVVTDLTEKRHAEALISKLTAAIEQNPVGVLITDQHGRVEYVNRQLCKQTGYSATELLGMSPNLLQPQDTPPETFKTLWNALRLGSERSGNLCDRKKNGESYWVHEVIFPISTDRREVTHYVGFQEDITARIRAEQELQASETNYSLLVENALIGIYVVQDDLIAYANPRLAEIFGYERAEMVGMPLARLLHRSEQQRLRDFLAVDGTSPHVESRYLVKGIRKDGQTVLCRKCCTRIEFRGRDATLGNMVDVTQEQALAQQVNASMEKIRLMTERLLAVEEQEKRRVASDLHDSIGQYLNALKMGLQSAGFQSCHGLAREDRASPGTDLLALTEEAIEEVRRIASDLRPAMLDDLGIAATINWFCRRFQTQHPTLQIEPRIEIGHGDLPEKLTIIIFRVLQESLNNAAKHAQADRISVSLTQFQEVVEFSVTDNGRGFDVTAAQSRELDRQGFGLINMRERVSLSGGIFEIQSSSGQGTRIRAYWDL